MTQTLAYDATTTSSTSEYSTLVRDAEVSTYYAVDRHQADYPVTPEMQNVTFELQHLPGNRLSLIAPLPVLVSLGPVDTVVTSRILETYGVGDSPREALADWSAEIEYEYYYLAENADRLGPSLRRRWATFQEYLQPTLFG